MATLKYIFRRDKMELIKDFIGFLSKRKKWWLLPVIIVLLFLILIILLGGSSPFAPFIYTIF